MPGLLLLLLELMPSVVGLSSALSPHLRPQSFPSQKPLFPSKNAVSYQGTRTVQNGVTHFSANEEMELIFIFNRKFLNKIIKFFKFNFGISAFIDIAIMIYPRIRRAYTRGTNREYRPTNN